MGHLTKVKEVPNAVLFNDEKGNPLIKLSGVRFSYPHIDKPFKGKNDKGEDQSKYGVKAMLPKATHDAAKSLVLQVIADMLKANQNATVATDKKFIRNGNDLDNPVYIDHFIVSANESRQPKARNEKNELITDGPTIANLFRGGYWGEVLIRPWFQDGQKVGKGYGKRVNAGLVGIRFTKKDETFGEGEIDDTDAWGSVDADSNDAMSQDEF